MRFMRRNEDDVKRSVQLASGSMTRSGPPKVSLFHPWPTADVMLNSFRKVSSLQLWPIPDALLEENDADGGATLSTDELFNVPGEYTDMEMYPRCGYTLYHRTYTTDVSILTLTLHGAELLLG